MKKNLLSPALTVKVMLSAVVLITLFLGGCGNSSNSTPPAPTIESLDVTPKAETLDIGTTQKYTAMAKYSDNSYEDVSGQVAWSLADGSGGFVIFDQADPSIARAAVVGTDHVVATLGALTTTESERAEVIVIDETLISIELTPVDPDLILGVTHQFTATGTYQGGRTQDLTEESNWTSGNIGFVTISENGLASPVAEGQTTITASFDGQAGITNVGINDPDKIDHIVITPEGYDFLTGEFKQFNAHAHFSDPSKENEIITGQCTWISSDTSLVALVSGVNTRKGYFNAKDTAGNATITADFNIKHAATINITIEKPSVNRIEIRPSIVTLSVGEDRQFFTDAVDQDGRLHSIDTHPDQEYIVDNPSIVSIANDPDNAGRARALSVGQAIITSTFVYEGETFTTHAVVTVTP